MTCLCCPLLLLLPAATCMNETSSRSHCIVTVTVEKCCPDGSVLVGKLKMVDLAGRWVHTRLAGHVFAGLCM
jgi:hypothetical protein